MLSLQGREFLINLHTLALYIKETLHGLLEDSASSCDGRHFIQLLQLPKLLQLLHLELGPSRLLLARQRVLILDLRGPQQLETRDTAVEQCGHAGLTSAPFVPASFSDFLP